jgi:hypothetical protein
MLQLVNCVTLGHSRRQSDPDSSPDVWARSREHVTTQITRW